MTEAVTLLLESSEAGVAGLMIPEGPRRYWTVDLTINLQGCRALTRAKTALPEGLEAGVLEYLEASLAEWKLEGLEVMEGRCPPLG